MTDSTKHHHVHAVDRFMSGLIKRNRGEEVFHQAVREAMETLIPFVGQHPHYRDAQILERLTEPDRIVIFRVTWQDDEGRMRVNRGWRVQFNNSIGPYKGGLRFHPSVDLGVLKFLGFEQVLKNSLTTLPLGGAKGGSNFNPKGKSDNEVMRFCQSFMTELHRHIGADVDVPAGDIGVGAREISYLFGQYKRLSNHFTGAITGKALSFGGSLIRTEATGYGAVYFMDNMLQHAGRTLDGATCTVSGSGNVALYTMEKLAELGAIPVTASDSSGFIHDPAGITGERLTWLKELKEVRRGRISEYAEEFVCAFYPDQRPWSVPCDLAFPCATQNEVSTSDAATLVANGLVGLVEAANMPTELSAIRHLQDAGVLFGPAKAANAGGVAVSGLEQTQNATRLSWSRDEVDARLQDIMHSIHGTCVLHGEEGRRVDYVKGANIGGFVKVADAMLAFGAV